MNPHEHLKGETYVYVLDCSGRCKIGIARDTYARISHMQMHCPMPIGLASERKFHSREAARLVERDLHAKFASTRLWGEWFDISSQDASEALQAHDGVAEPVAFEAQVRHPDLLPPKRPRPPRPSVPNQDRLADQGERKRATWDEMEAMTDDEWVEHMRPVAAALNF